MNSVILMLEFHLRWLLNIIKCLSGIYWHNYIVFLLLFVRGSFGIPDSKREEGMKNSASYKNIKMFLPLWNIQQVREMRLEGFYQHRLGWNSDETMQLREEVQTWMRPGLHRKDFLQNDNPYNWNKIGQVYSWNYESRENIKELKIIYVRSG